MNINTSPDQISRSSAQVTPGYMSGFGNSFETESLPGALPIGRNSPHRCAYGLYAEQLSGSPFTAPRGTNELSWLYRIRPSVKHSGRFAKVDAGLWRSAPCHEYDLPIGQLRWDPTPIPTGEVTFLQGVQTMTTAGDVNTQAGMAAHVYLITKSMVDQHFYNADAEMLFVLQQGNLRLVTEFGRIDAEPGEIVVIPRGVKFRVEIPSGPARGYLCENYSGAFTLPERGPIGANCLANARDFLTPVAAYGLCTWLGLQGPALQAGMIQSSMPAAVVTTILALQYEVAPNLVTSVVFVSTALSPFTLTALIAFLQRHS